jgi:enamidase
MSEREIDSLVATSMALEIVHCGNGKTALHTLARAKEARALHRIIIGNDAPSGTGVVPLGIIRVIAHLASLGGVSPETAICMASGNTARVYNLPVGVIAAGREADLCIVDAPVGSVGTTALEALTAGDLFGISMALIDGQIRIGRSRNTPPAARAAEVVKGRGPSGGGH